MLFRLASLLLLSLSFFGALATTTLGKSVKAVQVPDGMTDPLFGKGYWFQEIHADKATTIADADLQVSLSWTFIMTKTTGQILVILRGQKTFIQANVRSLT